MGAERYDIYETMDLKTLLDHGKSQSHAIEGGITAEMSNRVHKQTGVKGGARRQYLLKYHLTYFLVARALVSTVVVSTHMKMSVQQNIAIVTNVNRMDTTGNFVSETSWNKTT